jgi:hypothetical protein
LSEPSSLPPPFWRTRYFDEEVMSRKDRAGITLEDVLSVLAKPDRMLVQADGRVRYWSYLKGAGKMASGCDARRQQDRAQRLL